MKRKAIQLASQTIVVSLPAKWVKKQGIKKGDEIELNDIGNKLFISANVNNPIKKITIEAKSKEIEVFKKTLVAIMNAGYNEIEINFDILSLEETITVHKFLRDNFTDISVIKSAKNKFFIKTISQDDSKEIENMLRRFFLIVINLIEETAMAINKRDTEEFFKISLIRFDLYRLSNSIKRIINLQHETKYSKVAPFYAIIEGWTYIANIYLKLGRYFIDNKPKINEEIAKFAYELIKMHEEFYNVFYKFEIKEAQDLYIKYTEKEKILPSLITKPSLKEIKIINYYTMALDQLKELTRMLITLYI